MSKAEEKKLKAAQEISENFEVGILFWLQYNLYFSSLMKIPIYIQNTCILKRSNPQM